MKKLFVFSILTCIFSVLIFWGELTLVSLQNNPEEDFIEESVYDDPEDDLHLDYIDLAHSVLERHSHKKKEEERKKMILEKLKRLQDKSVEEKLLLEKELLLSAPDIQFMFAPKNFTPQTKNGKELVSGILQEKAFKEFIKQITISFYEERIDVRGKMKNKTIKLFDPDEMEEDEFLAIFIHEFAHYIDLYFLSRDKGEDISNHFYDISWYSTKVLHSGQTGGDFVSGYGMTNKYEDFAESLTYYVFHNEDFLEKTKKSDILLQKYNFFGEFIFPYGLFKNTDFSTGNTIRNYYRDITKIEFSKKNFLQYVKNSI